MHPMAILITIPAVRSVKVTQQLYITRPNSQKNPNKINCIIYYNTLTHTHKKSIIVVWRGGGGGKRESKLCIFVPYFEKFWNSSLAGVQDHASDQALPYALTNFLSEVIQLGIIVQKYQKITYTEPNLKILCQKYIAQFHLFLTPHPPAIFLKNKMPTAFKINRNGSLPYSTR